MASKDFPDGVADGKNNRVLDHRVDLKMETSRIVERVKLEMQDAEIIEGQSEASMQATALSSSASSVPIPMDMLNFLNCQSRDIVGYWESSEAIEVFDYALLCILTPCHELCKAVDADVVALSHHMTKNIHHLCQAFHLASKDFKSGGKVFSALGGTHGASVTQALQFLESLDDDDSEHSPPTSDKILVTDTYYDTLLGRAIDVLKAQIDVLEKDTMNSENATSKERYYPQGWYTYQMKFLKSNIAKLGGLKVERDTEKRVLEEARRKEREDRAVELALLNQTANVANLGLKAATVVFTPVVATTLVITDISTAVVGGVVDGTYALADEMNDLVGDIADDITEGAYKVDEHGHKTKRKRRFRCFGCISADNISDKPPPGEEEMKERGDKAVDSIPPSAVVAPAVVAAANTEGGTYSLAGITSNSFINKTIDRTLSTIERTQKITNNLQIQLSPTEEEEVPVVLDNYDFKLGEFDFNGEGTIRDNYYKIYLLLVKILLQHKNPEMETPEELESSKSLPPSTFDLTTQAHQKSVRTKNSSYFLSGFTQTAVDILDEVQIHAGLDQLFVHVIILSIIVQNFKGSMEEMLISPSDSFTKVLRSIKKRLDFVITIVHTSSATSHIKDLGMHTLNVLFEGCSIMIKEYHHYFKNGNPEGCFPLVINILELVCKLQPLLHDSGHPPAVKRHFEPFKKVFKKLISERTTVIFDKNKSIARQAPEGFSCDDDEILFDQVFSDGYLGLKVERDKLNDKSMGKFATVVGFDLHPKSRTHGLAEVQGIIKVGDKIVGVGEMKTYVDRRVLLEDKKHHHTEYHTSDKASSPSSPTAGASQDISDETVLQAILQNDNVRPLSLRILRTLEVDTDTTSTIAFPLNAYQMNSITRAIIAEYKSTEQYYPDSFDLLHDKNVFENVNETPLSLHHFEIIEYYSSLMVEIIPFMQDFPISRHFFDNDVLELYKSLTELDLLLQASKLLNVYIRPVKYSNFFGRHVHAWIDMRSKKMNEEWIPRLIESEKWKPFSEVDRHSQSCIDLESFINEAVQAYRDLPVNESDSTGIPTFGKKLLCSPIEFYTSAIGKEIKESLSSHTQSPSYLSFMGFKSPTTSPPPKRRASTTDSSPVAHGNPHEPNTLHDTSLDISLEICVKLNCLSHLKLLLRRVMRSLKAESKRQKKMTVVSKGKETEDTKLRDDDDDEIEEKDDLVIHSVEVKILRGYGLPKMDTIGSCDTYLILKCSNSEQDMNQGIYDSFTTPVIYNSYNPEWKNCVTPISFGDMISNDPLLIVEVLDSDLGGLKDELIGSLTIPLKDIVDIEPKEEGDLYDIDSSGLDGVPPHKAKLRLQVRMDTEQIGGITERLINSTTQDCIDLLIHCFFSKGIDVYLTELIFAHPLPPNEEVATEVMDTRLQPLLNYLYKQFSTLHIGCDPQIFEKILTRSLRVIVIELVNIIALHSFLNPRARKSETHKGHGAWVTTRVRLEDYTQKKSIISSIGGFFHHTEKNDLILCTAQLCIVSYIAENVKSFFVASEKNKDGVRQSLIDKECKQLDQLILLLFGLEDELEDFMSSLEHSTPKTVPVEAPPISHGPPSNVDPTELELEILVKKLQSHKYEVGIDEAKAALLYRNDY